MSVDGHREMEPRPSSFRCPHCLRPWDEQETTTVRCGACDAPQDLPGNRWAVADRVWECPACGQLNHVPRPEEADDG